MIRGGSKAPLAFGLTAFVTLAATPAVAQPTPALAPSATTTASSADLPSLFTRFNIRPIDPPSAASDFRLPDLAGGESSLSDYYGSWVVLTFFATWCGPCRSELPTLETLHRQRAADGIVVLGVSIDDPGAPLQDFVRQLKLSFPILWDKTQQIGATYRASSIPISYLVSPEGQLVGVSRGSRDWAALSPMFDGALQAVPATLTLEPSPDAYADAAEPVATPSVSDPPTADVFLRTEKPKVGKPFQLDVVLHWAGNFQEYLPHPPEILLPEGVVQESVTAETSSRDGRNQLTYRATLRADEPGKYALDPVEVRYTPRFESTPVAGRVLGPTVEVVAPTILGLAPVAFAGSVAGLAFLGVAGWAVGRKLRAARQETPSPAVELYDELHAAFEEARKKRLAGDGAGHLLGLAEVDRRLHELAGEAPPDDAAQAELDQAVERARYGGEVPPAEELEALQRGIERRLQALRPDPEGDARQGLKLKD
ncbi:MAG: TlpA disulfide reductase family protein [Acidobacteriota bacterium]